MANTIIWESRSSAFLYSYQYAFCILLAIALSFFDYRLLIIPIVISTLLMLDAITMKYELTKDSIYISPSLFDNEDMTVALKDIVGLYNLQPPFFKFLSLGTIILITDYSEQEHPCIKCISHSNKIENIIMQLAKSRGAAID